MRASPLAQWDEPDAVLQNCHAIDMIVLSVPNSLNSSGGFCTGSRIVVDHQRINGMSSVFSAAVPALLSTSASEGINILQNMPLILSEPQENKRAIRITSPGQGHHDPLTRCLVDHPTST
ncbi:hypothetical protein H4582DRAFT_2079084 [Lactarius indigo]|nr:hypothetical protein H4582DRAFT_2079084 [Lactarius indigo]